MYINSRDWIVKQIVFRINKAKSKTADLRTGCCTLVKQAVLKKDDVSRFFAQFSISTAT